MDYVSPILELRNCLWPKVSKRVAYLRHRKQNLQTLETAVDQLNNLRQDVKTGVEREEEQQRAKRTNQVDSWLIKAEKTEAEVAEVLQQGKEEDGKKCLGNCCPKNCKSSYKIGKKLAKMITDVEKLRSDGHFDVLVHKLPRASVDELPMEKAVVGLDVMFEKVWRSVEDRNVGIIGLFGLGGVGKTTLLRKINNEFLKRRNDFDVVMWVVASKKVNVEKVQEVIRNKLAIPDAVWMFLSDDEKGAEIYRILKSKKFVLLLDDIWERFDLSKVGVPFPDNQNESKVIFTTRSEEVCGCMQADRSIKVECLPDDEALTLFKKMVGEDTLNSNQEIPKLAEIVAKRCGGLPLALITVGRAMASRRNLQEWKHAIKALQCYPSQFSAMEDQVFSVIKFSYDSLKDDTMKKCFLYCALFAEDELIEKWQLIRLWIGEGFLDKFEDVHDARNEAEYIIGSLRLACLLETVESNDYQGESEEFLRMHDVIRDTALWLYCENGENKCRILVQDIPGPIKEQWKEVERMSLCCPYVNVVTGRPSFPNLRTFLFRKSDVVKFPSEFLQYMPALRVLDLSENHHLTELPQGIGELVNLQYLDLSWSSVAVLPIEIQNLKNLRCLILDNTKCLVIIPREVIPALLSLQVFSKLAWWDLSYDERFDEVAMLEDLECLGCINDISINLSTRDSVKKFLDSPKLQKCIRRLTFMECSEMTSLHLPSSSLRRMEHLERLDIRFCHSLVELRVHLEDEEKGQQTFGSDFLTHDSKLTAYQYFRALHFVHIRCCAMKDVTWLGYAPSLETLQLHYCDSLEEVIDDNSANTKVEVEQEIFSSLTELYLVVLPNLNSICRKVQSFPSLKKTYISKCPALKKLPFDSNSASSLEVIYGEKSWWDNLQWENELVKHVFSSKLIEWEFGLTIRNIRLGIRIDN